jgi:bifunctional DNA-binding transcriptional regulator/antitoxin component of YhaV-PrlF toxin-antitoxin module
MDISTAFKNGAGLVTRIPLNVRQALNLKPGDRLRWYQQGDGKLSVYVGERDDPTGRANRIPR